MLTRLLRYMHKNGWSSVSVHISVCICLLAHITDCICMHLSKSVALLVSECSALPKFLSIIIKKSIQHNFSTQIVFPIYISRNPTTVIASAIAPKCLYNTLNTVLENNCRCATVYQQLKLH